LEVLTVAYAAGVSWFADQADDNNNTDSEHHQRRGVVQTP